MTGRSAYLDTSAFVKLVTEEPESQALRMQLLRWPDRVSSVLLRTETVRVLQRSSNEQLIEAARALFVTLHLIRLDDPVLDLAGNLGPKELRSLDALHLATALSVGSDLGVFVTYDERLAAAAVAHGLVVEAPR